MRHGRSKLARKTLKFFSLNFGMKPPYQVLVDGNFLVAVIQQKVPIRDRLKKTLQNEEFNLLVCRSALDELATLIPNGDLFHQARQFGLDECDIIEPTDIPTIENEKEDETTAAVNDIYKLVLNSYNNHDEKKHQQQPCYIVATQDAQLADTLREIPKVLLVRLTRGVLILESPSSATRRACMQQERKKQSTGGGTMTQDEKEVVQQLQQQQRKRKSKEQQPQQQQRKKRKAKGPNPLSCKKKKSSSNTTKNKKS